METPSPLIDAVPATCLPLRIDISDAGHLATLQALVDQCVPVLREPENFTPMRRRELAERLARTIQPRGVTQEQDTIDSDDDSASANDPFRWTEDDQ